MAKALSKRAIRNAFFTDLITWLAVVGCTVLESLVIRKDAMTENLMITLLGLALVDAVIICVMQIYIARVRRSLLANSKMNATLFAIIAIGFATNTFLSSATPLAMPVLLFSMLASGFFDSRISFIANAFGLILLMMKSSVLDFAQSQILDMRTISVLIAGFLVGTLTTFAMGRDTKRLSFIMIGVGMGFLSAVFPVLFYLFDENIFVNQPVNYAFLAVLIFAPILLCLILQPILERVFNVTSNFRYVELTDPKSPLMRRLATEAPGTFNHSLTVANLVETCAAAIGENIYMARAAAYYHDIGKLKNPSMFSENQSNGRNIHDELTPEASTDIIRKHTIYGEQLCNENGIPCEIAQIAREHHGTTVIAFFLNKARDMTDGREVDIHEYSYAGPTPSTKIAALVMICDACEAAIRAMDKPQGEEVDKLVKEIIDARLQTGQFDDCPITMQDLHVARQTIVNAMCGLYHERIKYPKGDKA